MDENKVAKEGYLGGFNCCQSIVIAFSDELGLERDLALKIASGFGGGLKQGEVCGVVTGAIMVIGLKYGYISPEDTINKEKVSELTMRFQEIFKEHFDSILCRDLLGYDVAIPEENKYAKENKISKQVCPKYVTGAVEILNDLIK